MLSYFFVLSIYEFFKVSALCPFDTIIILHYIGFVAKGNVQKIIHFSLINIILTIKTGCDRIKYNDTDKISIYNKVLTLVNIKRV